MFILIASILPCLFIYWILDYFIYDHKHFTIIKEYDKKIYKKYNAEFYENQINYNGYLYILPEYWNLGIKAGNLVYSIYEMKA